MFLELHTNPWIEMDSMMKSMNDFFAYPHKTGKRSSSVDFPVNMWNDREKMVLTAELPGIEADKLAIDLVEDMLTIKGERKAKEDKGTYHRKERSAGNFKRIFQLPYKIDADKVEAKYQKGILNITLPRSEKDKPKKIEVSVG